MGAVWVGISWTYDLNESNHVCNVLEWQCLERDVKYLSLRRVLCIVGRTGRVAAHALCRVQPFGIFNLGP